MHKVITKFKEVSDTEGRPYTIKGSRFTSEGVTLNVTPDCESDDITSFKLSWPRSADPSSDMAYSMMLLLFTLGKGYDDDGLMGRIGQTLQTGKKFSEDRSGWSVSSSFAGRRCLLSVTKRP